MQSSTTQQLLETVSLTALELWQQLEQTDDPDEEQRLLDAIWTNESDRRTLIDSIVRFSIQIDAELDALKASKQKLVSVYDAATDRLERWKHQLNQSILRSNENNLIPPQITGNEHEIEIRLNPARCDQLTIPIEQIEPRYLRTKQVFELDKKAVIRDWNQGNVIEGVTVVRDRRVVYKLTATNREHLKLKSTESPTSPKHR